MSTRQPIEIGVVQNTDDGDEPDNRGWSIWWIAIAAALIALIVVLLVLLAMKELR